VNWLNANINHLTVPLGMALGILGAVCGFISLRKQKAGEPRPYISEGVKTGLIAVLVICGVLLGFAIAKSV
jgi:hypothetical protein